MDQWKGIVDLAGELIKSVAIILGGFWTYRLFVRQRLGVPRVNIELATYAFSLPDDVRVIHAAVEIVNVGSVILRSKYAELRLRQVVPAPESVIDSAVQGYDPVNPTRTEVEWPLIAGREWNWKAPLEIEPGERDSLHADFIIDTVVQVAEFYFFLSNPSKRRRGLGWTLTKVQELNEEKEPMSESTSKKASFRSGQQEKQQPQQQRQPQQQKQEQQQQKQEQQQQQKGEQRQDQQKQSPPASNAGRSGLMRQGDDQSLQGGSDSRSNGVGDVATRSKNYSPN